MNLTPFLPCAFFTLDISPGGQAGAIYVYLFFPEIAVGAEVRCSLSLEAIEGASGRYTLGTQLYPVFLDNSAAYVDPNPGNDRAEATIVLPGPPPNAQPVVVPSMTAGGMVLLGIVVGLLGLRRRQRQHPWETGSGSVPAPK